MFYKRIGLVPIGLTMLLLNASSLMADWTAASTLSSGGDAENVHLGVDSSGNAFANWQFYLTSTQVIQSSLLPVGGAWTNPIDVSDPSDVVDYHSLAVDQSGNAYALWNPIDSGEAFILAASRPAYFTWTSSTILQDSVSDSNPRVAAYNAVFAVWTGIEGSNTVIQSSNFADGGWLLPAVTISDPSQNSDQASIGVDGFGNAIAVWESNNGSNTIIQAAINVGGVWSSPYNLSYDGSDSLLPQIAVNSSGNAVAVWKTFNGANWVIQSSTFIDETWWTSPVQLSLPEQDADLPQVSIDYAGNAVAVWKRYDGSNYIIEAAAAQGGVAWTRSASLSAAGEDADTPQVAANNSSQVVAVWSRSNGLNFIVENSTTTLTAVSGHPFGDFWTTPVDLSLAGEDALNPQVTVDPSGNAVVAWQYGSVGAYAIQAVVGTGLFP